MAMLFKKAAVAPARVSVHIAQHQPGFAAADLEYLALLLILCALIKPNSIL
jgi:hypothetical protein